MEKSLALYGRHYILKAVSLCASIVMSFLFVWGTTARAQSSCYLNCQEGYSACLRSDPLPAGCEMAYDNCIEACL
jgi:hypothetical protein